MNTRNRRTTRVRNALAAFLLGALSLGNALADDIEIYVGGESSTVGTRPNILLVIDTSGSMSGQVVEREPYNPATTYTGGSCDTDKVYFRRSSWFSVNCDWSFTYRAVDTSSFVCDAATDSFNAVGYMIDRFAQWDDGDWEDIRNESDIVECASDSGTHGGGTAGYVYAANGGDGPFSNDSSDVIDWDDEDFYTIHSGNYLNWRETAPIISIKTRLEVVQDVTKDLLDEISNVNVGLMRFDSSADGGMVLHEVADLATARGALKTQVDNLTANGNTPLSETLYEAGQYYMGRGVDFGDYSSPVESASASRDGDTYISPIQYQCQKNFIVYLTDGEPTSDGEAENRIDNWPDGPNNCSGNCLDEISGYLFGSDLNSSFDGTQNAITYTIGFLSDQDLLNEAAQEGGGEYYTANNAEALQDALTNIVTEVLDINSTFTAPAVSVNAFNRTVHLDQLFFTIFKPSERPHWNGNLKRFDVGESNGEIEILDVHGNPAVDPATGFFADNAESYWTLDDQDPDGGEAALGGAAGTLELPRKVYTYTGSADLLTDASNEFHEDNSLVTAAKLSIPGADAAYRTKLIQWARGLDVDDDDSDGSTTDARRIMGDPLHSKPVVVTYGGSSSSPDFTVYMTTNDGFFHAIDGNSGEELFAFIPESHWDALNALYENASAEDKNYGLDGSITPWVKDVNGNGAVEPSDGDHVYLYFGERRGGKSYYALDVTLRDQPKFLWKVSKSTAGFGELAQTWSQPRLATVRIGASEKHVLIFGGGYDESLDELTAYQDDDEGRAIFMVDATNGDLLWWAGPSGSGANLELASLQSSIPAEVRVIDMNSDGFHDRMYVGDMGGRLFRFDIINGNTVGQGLVDGGQIASLGAGDLAGATAEDNRKFFYPPDAALIVDGESSYISLAIGSGNQTEPLQLTTQDRFFVVRDPNVFNVPDAYTESDGTLITVNETAPANSDLYNATENLAGQGSDAERSAAISAMDSRDGWYIDLVSASGVNEGEKVLSEATTIQGTVFFTTFTPTSSVQQTNACAPSQGIARVYNVDVQYARPVRNFNETGSDDALTREDRASTLARGGIPPEVTILFTDAGPIALVGPEKLPVDLINMPVKTYWYEEDVDE